MTNMFRSIQHVLDHADELADRCEAYEPSPDDERPVAEYLLKRAAEQKARCEHQIAQAIAAARADGSSWQDINRILSPSEDTADQRDRPLEGGSGEQPSDAGDGLQAWVFLIERTLDTGADLSLYWQEIDARRAALAHMTSNWTPEAGPMPNDVHSAIEIFNAHHHGCEHIWLGSIPINATYSEGTLNSNYDEPKECGSI